MNAVLEKLPALMAEELKAANKENPPFHSMHEGWAVLKEEVEETSEACKRMAGTLEYIWGDIRKNNPPEALITTNLRDWAYQTAAEAIQVAAMAQKLLNGIEKGFKGGGKK